MDWPCSHVSHSFRKGFRNFLFCRCSSGIFSAEDHMDKSGGTNGTPTLAQQRKISIESKSASIKMYCPNVARLAAAHGSKKKNQQPCSNGIGSYGPYFMHQKSAKMESFCNPSSTTTTSYVWRVSLIVCHVYSMCKHWKKFFTGELCFKLLLFLICFFFARGSQTGSTDQYMDVLNIIVI